MPTKGWPRGSVLGGWGGAARGGSAAVALAVGRGLAAAVDVLKAVGAIRPRPEPPEPGKTGPRPSLAYDVHADLLGAPEMTANTAIPPSKAPDEANSGNGGNSRASKRESDPTALHRIGCLQATTRWGSW